MVESISRPAAGAALATILEDEVAFRAWYDDALPKVFGYLYTRCGRDRELAEELTQQTFVDVVGARAHDVDDPTAWLMGVARHRLADHFRRLERRERGFLRLLSSSGAAGVTWVGTSDPDDALIDALRRLPAGQRAAIILRYVDDLPVREVARLLGRSDGAVESLLSRGREALRHALGDAR